MFAQDRQRAHSDITPYLGLWFLPALMGGWGGLGDVGQLSGNVG